MDRFKATYGREIEPMIDKTQWPQVELPFVVCAPLAKGNMGRRRKLRLKGCLEGGNKKKGAKDVEGDNATAPNNDTALTNAKENKMIRGPMTCKKCGEKGHRQASSSVHSTGQRKRGKSYFFVATLESPCHYKYYFLNL